jgi:excisionase family DNA binding protein
MQPALYLTADQVAERYAISRSTVYELVARGELPASQHFGRAARWRVADLEASERAPHAEASS